MRSHIDEKTTEYHGRLLKRISDLDAEIALIRSEEPTRVEMQNEIIRLQADISRLRDIIAALERALDVKHERIKELEGHAAGEDAYHHGYRDGYKAGLKAKYDDLIKALKEGE